MINSIKFFWNGIRVNGEKSLIKCSYSLDNHKDYDECVSITADSYGGVLPRDLFEVHNESDSYTDYFENDLAVLTPDHPLYKYARYAAAKRELRYLPRHIKYLEESVSYFPEGRKVEIEAKKERLAKLEAIQDPGHPKASDLEAVYKMRLEAENARIAAEHEAELKRREEHQRKINEGKAFIEKVAAEYPIVEGEPVVTINWSENPAFYSWDDNELKLSVAAAEIILKHFDEQVHAEQDRGYDKTKFTIEFVNEDGEQDTYEGRYDLGDNDGGMIEHIRAFGRYYKEREHNAEGEAILAFADMLEGYTARGKVIAVTLSPWIVDVIKAGADATDKQLAFMMGYINRLSIEDLEATVMAIDSEDPDQEIVAEFFVKQLAMRDVKKALEVYQIWKSAGSSTK